MSIATFNGGLVTCGGQLVTVGPGGTDCLPFCTSTGTIPGCPLPVACPSAIAVSINVLFDNGIINFDMSGTYTAIVAQGFTRWQSQVLTVIDSRGNTLQFLITVTCSARDVFGQTEFVWIGQIGGPVGMIIIYEQEAFSDGSCVPGGGWELKSIRGFNIDPRDVTAGGFSVA